MLATRTRLPLHAKPDSGLQVKAEVTTLDPLNDSSAWDSLVLAQPGGTIFHSSAWARVLNKTYGHRPFYLRVGGSGVLALMEVASPITGRRGVCLPFSDSCAPLGLDAHGFSAARDEISAIAQRRRWKYYELRGGDELMPASAFPARSFYGHSLPLDLEEGDVWQRLSSAVRRGIRRATKKGVKAEIGADRESVLQFFKLHGKTRRRHGLPPQPLNFFLSIYEEVIKAGHGFVVVARKGSRVIASAVFFKFGHNALYKFGASDEAQQEFRGNNLAMWEGIKFLCGTDCQRLDLGRTSLENSGLRHFKAGWGTTEQKLNYFVYDVGQGCWRKRSPEDVSFHHRLFGYMPLSINRLAGALVYPHLD